MESAIISIFMLLISEMVFALKSKEYILSHCMKPPKNVSDAHECCPMPDLFAMEAMAGCGMDLEDRASFPSLRGSPDCAQMTCLLRNHDLLFDNDDIDNESVKQFLDEWAEKRRQYVPAVNLVKEICLSGKTLFGFPQMCSVDKLILCVNAHFFKKCPHWKDLEWCNVLRSFFEDCMPYF